MTAASKAHLRVIHGNAPVQAPGDHHRDWGSSVLLEIIGDAAGNVIGRQFQALEGRLVDPDGDFMRALVQATTAAVLAELRKD